MSKEHKDSVGVEILSFEHDHKDVKTQLKVVKYGGASRNSVYLDISGEGNSIGYISGFWRDGENGAELQIRNTVNRPEEAMEKHVPRAVGATVFQLIKRRIVAVVRSDGELSPSARAMYTWLGRQDGLSVKPPTAETRISYVVTKQNP